MSMLTALKNKIFETKRSRTLSGVFAVVLVGLIGFAAPNIYRIAKGDGTCPSFSNTPIFNPYPVSFSTPVEACHDAPALVVRNSNNPTYGGSASGQSGDEFYVRMWIHNGANDLNVPVGVDNVAHNVQVHVNMDTATSTSHSISATFTANNAPTFNAGSVSISTGSNTQLEVVQGSGEIFDYQANLIDSGFTVANGGAISLGDQNACFTFGKFIRFKVRVVATTPPPTQLGCIDIVKETFDINGNPIRPVAQFTFHLTNSGVTVVNDSNGNARFSNLQPGTYTVYEDVPSTWVQLSITPPGGNVQVVGGSSCATVVFKNRQQLLESTLQCIPFSQTFAEGPRSVSFTAIGGNGQYSWSANSGNPSTGSGSNFTTIFPGVGGVVYTAVVTSGTQNATCRVNFTSNPPPPSPVVCTPSSQTVDINQTAFFSASGGTGSFSWSAPGGNPTSGSGSNFSTSYSTGGTKTVTVTSGTQSANCFVNVNTPPPPQLSCTPPTQTVDINQTAMFAAFGGTGSFSWSAPSGNPSTGSGTNFATSYSSGGTKTVVVTSGSQSASCNVFVNTPPPQLGCIDVTKETFDTNGGVLTPVPQFTFQFDSGATAVNGGDGHVRFNNVSVGSHTITELLPNGWTMILVTPTNGVVQVASGSNCASVVFKNRQNAIVNPVVCSPSSQTVNINQTAFFSATGGTGSFSWSAPSGNPSTGSGINFSTSYNSTGSKTVTVSSGSQSASCAVNVVSVAPPQLSCIPSNQSVFVNHTAFFSATGGTGSFSWSAPNGNPSTGSGSNFNTAYSFVGNQTVSVRSGDLIATCNVSITNPPVQTVFCAPASQSVNVNQTAFFTASGGNGTFTWSAPNGNPSTGSGSNFNTTYANSGQQIVTVQSAGTQASCSILVNSVTPNLVLSKKAFDDTRNVDVTNNGTANREDFITYTLVTSNLSSVAVNRFTISDDLSGILPFADVTDFGGGSMFGNVISYPATAIPANSQVVKTFRVRVKFHLDSTKTFVLQNTYGNTVQITVPGTTKFVAPKTGNSGTSAAAFAGLVTSGFILWKKRRGVFNFVLAK